MADEPRPIATKERMMFGRRAVIGLSLLSALVFCAFAAQSASAEPTVTSQKTTAVTCVPELGNKGDFEDAHCDKTHPKKEGAFTHATIANGIKTETSATNEKVTPNKEGKGTTEPESAILRSTVSLVKTEITCAKVRNNVKTSYVENSEPVPTKHTVSGTAETEFTECTVKKPEKCTVTEPIVSKAKVHGVEGIEGPTKGPKGEVLEPNAMGLEFIGEGEEETFAELEFKNKGAEICGIKGVKAKVKGRLVATNGPTTESDQENKETGATLVFTPKFKMETTLKLGKEAAEFETITTQSMSGGNPIALTTTP